MGTDLNSPPDPATLNFLQADSRDEKSAEETSWRSRKAVTPERGIKRGSGWWVSFLGTIAQNKLKRRKERVEGLGEERF